MDKKIWVEWIEPFGPNNEPVFCRVLRETAIATQKVLTEKAKPGFIYETDEQALDDFVVVHWAKIILDKEKF